MNVPGWLILNVYVSIILIVLLSMTLRKRVSTNQDRSFALMLSVVLGLLVADSFGKSHLTGPIGFRLTRVGTYIIFANDPVGYLVALLYIDSWTAGKKEKKEKIFYGIVYSYVLLNFVMVTISEIFHFGWFYFFAGEIFYHGSFFVVRGLLNMVFCAVISLYIFLKRQEIRTQYTSVIVVFPLIILFSGFLQVFIGGASYEYAGSVLACLLLFLKVQAHNIDDDYLTGLLNRRGFTHEFEYQCAHYRRDNPFFVCFIDIDFFKEINDTYGHLAGDEALIHLSELLLATFGREAVIGRYGGDEFVVLAFEKDEEQAKKKLEELRNRCRVVNRDREYDYPLSISAGFAFYDPDTYSDIEQFFREVDDRMYREKASHHALRNTTGKTNIP